MTFFLHHREVVMSSQTTQAQSSNMHPLTHILDTCALIFSSCTVFTLYPNQIKLLYPTPLQVITTKAWESSSKEHRPKQKCPCETESVTYAHELSALSCLLRIILQPPLSFPCCPRPPSHHPSSLTSVYLIPAPSTSTINTLLSTHLFFPYAQTISMLSDLLYSLTPFLYQLSYTSLHS